MDDPQQKPDKDAREGRVDFLRALRWAVLLFGVFVLAVVVATLLTDGTPDLPFDYEGRALD